jgi:hypothetical protein
MVVAKLNAGKVCAMKNWATASATALVVGDCVLLAIAGEDDREPRYRQVQAIIDRLKSEKMAEAEAVLSELGVARASLCRSLAV